MSTFEELDLIAQSLKKKHANRRKRQLQMQKMARNLDPRTNLLGGGNENGVFENRLSPRGTGQTFLKTNDPRTFLDLVVFPLAANQLQWSLPVSSRHEQDDTEASQKPEIAGG